MPNFILYYCVNNETLPGYSEINQGLLRHRSRFPEENLLGQVTLPRTNLASASGDGVCEANRFH